jgi:DNA gyrase/topoisomerase IV subunit B
MRELLIVEGDSAANAIRRCSLPAGTSVACLQGKPPNVHGLSRAAVQSNPFLQAIVFELNEDWESLDRSIGNRFDQVGLVMDPDADGMHCSLLLLWFFRDYMPSWLEAGCIFQVILPRFEIRVQGQSLQHYAFTEAGAERLANQLRTKRLPGQVRVAKVRGIAALPADLLHDYCLQSSRRKKTVLTVQDADLGWNRS